MEGSLGMKAGLSQDHFFKSVNALLTFHEETFTLYFIDSKIYNIADIGTYVIIGA